MKLKTLHQPKDYVPEQDHLDALSAPAMIAVWIGLALFCVVFITGLVTIGWIILEAVK